MNGSAHCACLAALALVFLGGCSAYRVNAPAHPALAWPEPAMQPAASGTAELTPAPAFSVHRQAVEIATAQIGAPYSWGGRGPDTFDCSGLVYYAYRAAGVPVPRTSGDQYRAAQPVPLAQARPGDLLFFSFTDKISHVGIYLGDQRFVHAPQSGDHVSIETLNHDYYRSHFVAAGRLTFEP